MVEPEGFTVVDGTTDIEEQQKKVREKIMEILPRQQFARIRAGKRIDGDMP